jgi:hypothetical protein
MKSFNKRKASKVTLKSHRKQKPTARNAITKQDKQSIAKTEDTLFP